MQEHIAVLGAGSWGTALALVLASKGYAVRLWGRPEDNIAEIGRGRENPLLPGVFLPDNVVCTAELDWAMQGAELVVMSVPAQAVRSVLGNIKSYLAEDQIIVNTAKGIEMGTGLRLSQVAEEVLGKGTMERFAVLSGPSHAEEVARGVPTAIVAAATTSTTAYRVQDIFMKPEFRVYTNPDITGVEMGGALKNVIALGTGIAEGLGLGDNTKAALLTRGLTEISRMGMAAGAKPITFAGLSGIGDLVVTCNSMHSRNRRCGILIGQKVPAGEAVSRIGMVVEGVATTKAAAGLAERLGVEMPITRGIYQVLFAGEDPETVLWELMTRARKHESEEIALMNKDW